ncbi:hypothetical protein K488DRAFT_49991, partial [Vararia minispora EC-137]
VVMTSQLATKLVHADGTSANFDTGAKAVLVPQLGQAHLPLARSYQVLIVPETRTTGSLRLLSYPAHVQTDASKGKQYEMVCPKSYAPSSSSRKLCLPDKRRHASGKVKKKRNFTQ